jgi:Uma2 family endonuclease
VLGDDEDPQTAGLAIEVVVTSGGISKLDVYRKLGVREVWFWRRGRIDLFALRDEQYEPIAGSELIPGLDLDLLLRFVDVRPTTKAVRGYREALRAAGP